MKHQSIYTFLLSLLSVFAGAFSAHATENELDPEHFKKKTLLIINSYNEQALWSRDMITPITYYVSQNDEVHAELYALNNVLITDSARYQEVSDNLFATYRDHHPDYLVIIGGLAFTLRDRIQKEWKDIPMVLITRDMTLAPPSYFFSGYDMPISDQVYPSLSELLPKFNFTTIYVPDFYREAIDMMVQMIPEMDEFVFFSDPIYLNRHLARNIEDYISENYPAITYKWVQASGDRPDDLQYYFVHPLPHTGLLLSTWYYEKPNSLGYPSLTAGDISLLNTSCNPVFSLRETYIKTGAIGGVYANNDSIYSEIVRLVDAMVNGKQMRDVKFIVNRNDIRKVINYPKLVEYEIPTSLCPKDTVFINRPQSLWKKYFWYIIGLIIILALMVILFVRYNISQHKEISILKRHRDFVEKMPVPFSKAKLEYNDRNQVIDINYTLYNDQFAEILAANSSKQNPNRLFPQEFISEKCAELLKDRKTVAFKYHFDQSDTDYIFVICFVGDATINDHGQIDEIDIFANDITQRQKNEEELKLITYKLDLTLNVAKLIPWELNLTNNQLSIDSHSIYERSTSRITDNGIMKPNNTIIDWYEHVQQIHPDDREIILNALEDIRQRRRTSFRVEYRMAVAQSGEDKYEWIDCNGAVTGRDKDGVPTVVSGSIKIITERKEQEQALIEAREKALESDKLKSAFLANMSHEIRTPLNAIVGFSSLLGETEDINKRREFSKIISQNNDMLLSLVNDVLDLAKIESNTLEVCDSVVDLNGLMYTVSDTAKMNLHKDVTLNTVLGSDNCLIFADGNRISQVLMNLLTNAAKFTPQGSITVGYDIIDNKEIYFYVKDTGIGVSADDQKKLFNRFVKLNNFKPGNGLGLSICKSLVELMDGHIGMKSRGEGKGSTFWFDIPYRPVSDAQEVTEVTEVTDVTDNPDTHISNQEIVSDLPHAWMSSDSDREVQVTEIPATDTQAEKADDASLPEREKVILVAEDIEGNYLLLKHLIPKQYKVVHAWDGQEAVEMFSQYQPDIVLMDISMPVMDGYKAAEEIRKISNDVPIVAVTAFAYASDRKRILKSGFNDYLSKPVLRDDLLEVFKRYL